MTDRSGDECALWVGPDACTVTRAARPPFVDRSTSFHGPDRVARALGALCAAVHAPALVDDERRPTLVRSARAGLEGSVAGHALRVGPFRRSGAGLRWSVEVDGRRLPVEPDEHWAFGVSWRGLSAVREATSPPAEHARSQLPSTVDPQRIESVEAHPDLAGALAVHRLIVDLRTSRVEDGTGREVVAAADPVAALCAATQLHAAWVRDPLLRFDPWAIPLDYARAPRAEVRWTGVVGGRAVRIDHPVPWRGGWVVRATHEPPTREGVGAGGSPLEAVHMALFRCGVLTS